MDGGMVCVGSRSKDDDMNGTAHRYRVVEIFRSIDGEGRRTGMTAQFVRLAGCNLRCSYCDTVYALYGEKEECKYREMSADEIMAGLDRRIPRITLTGGEPLLHKNVCHLLRRLSGSGYEINVETNGAVPVAPLWEAGLRETVFCTVDYKLPSSGMERHMLMDNYFCLSVQDVVKFVVGDDGDIDPMLSLVKRMLLHYGNFESMPQIYIGVVWGRYDARRIVELMLDEPLLSGAHMQLQMHKFIWSPDERGV